MTKKKAIPPAAKKETLVETTETSIPDQIYEELIRSIKASGKFDPDSLNRLEVSIANGGIKKSAEVIKAIRKLAGE